MELYFIANLPDTGLREQIKGIKEEVKENYGVKHALKLPAHITLQPPFKLAEEEEPGLNKALDSLADKQQVFKVNLNGFGSFPPRVIFIKVENHESLVHLQNEIREEIQNFVKPEKSSSFHPHITVATRDLDKKRFKEVWPEFRNREFEATFEARSIVLFKHNGKTWDLHREFSFIPSVF